MASVVQSVKCGVVNTTDTSTMVYYAIKFVSEAYTLQYDTTCDSQLISSGELVVNSQYLICIQENTNWCCKQKKQQQVIIVPARTIVHPCLDFVAVKRYS